MELLKLFGFAAAAAMSTMTLVWLLSLQRRNASIVDSFWGPGFVVVAAVCIAVSGAVAWRETLVLALVTVWGVRLSAHITRRNWGRGEDWRYRKWRDAAPETFWWRSLFKVFLLQAVLLLVVASPIIAAIAYAGPNGFTALDAAGITLWAIGFAFEVVGDEQLRRFKADAENRGKVCDRGLWRYTRHPNYFGEALLWWGVFLIASSAVEALWSVVGPAAITFLLLRVSGVRLLEKGLKETKPQYADYVRRTSAFFPWPPRKI